MRNLSYENEFYSQVHSNANHTHFHMKDFALGLGLKQRQKATRKWPIVNGYFGGITFMGQSMYVIQTLEELEEWFGYPKKNELRLGEN